MPYGVQQIKAAYDFKYSETYFRMPDAYFKRALKLLAPREGERMLDIGCAVGDFLSLAAQSGARCHGLDISPVAVREARRRVPSAQVMVGSAEELAFADESFDCVSLLSCLEHLLDPAKGLMELRRVLKWGGRALIIVPNGYYLPDLLWLVTLKGYGPSHKQIVERFAAAQEWRAYLESAGLTVRRIERYNFPWPRSANDLAWYRANPRRWLGMLAAPLIPFNLSNSFLYLCDKDPATRGQVFAPPPWPAPPKIVQGMYQNEGGSRP
jgi:ubiquinone/menaquinone biosynthesis C-methylase UbiE